MKHKGRWADGTRRYEKPTRTRTPEAPTHETVETHPAYAQIGASRVTGHAYLYGSEFDHQHYVTISIQMSDLRRGLSRDWHMPGHEYIQVALSEAQWATFVSSMNIGGGVCCTLQHLDQKSVPQIPGVEDRRQQFTEEVTERLGIAKTALTKLWVSIGRLSVSGKQKEELRKEINSALMNIDANLGFVADQFGEHVEKVLESAKVEIAAYTGNVIQRAGIEALGGVSPPVSLPASKKETPDGK